MIVVQIFLIDMWAAVRCEKEIWQYKKRDSNVGEHLPLGRRHLQHCPVWGKMFSVCPCGHKDFGRPGGAQLDHHWSTTHPFAWGERHKIKLLTPNYQIVHLKREYILLKSMRNQVDVVTLKLFVNIHLINKSQLIQVNVFSFLMSVKKSYQIGNYWFFVLRIFLM